MARAEKRAKGPATIFAMGTANPPNIIPQSKFPDYLFKVTNSEHKTDLKHKFEEICAGAGAGINKRHFCFTEEILKANPSICTIGARSLDVRQDFALVEVPRLAKEAALKAIEQWGQPKAKITHVVFAATSGLKAPGVELTLIKLLGLSLETSRVMLYQQDGYSGAAALRIAKDLAENNKGARVLVASSEVTAYTFHAPDEEHLDGLLTSALLGDGAAALIVGSDPEEDEKPLFQILHTHESILPDSEGAVEAHIREEGLFYYFSKDPSKEVPSVVTKHAKNFFEEILKHVGHPDYNKLFWAIHPSGITILNKLEEELGLEEDKLSAAREVLANYGNLSSAGVLFVIEQLYRHGISSEYGVVLGYGPGLTIETSLLKKVY